MDARGVNLPLKLKGKYITQNEEIVKATECKGGAVANRILLLGKFESVVLGNT